MVDLNHIFLFIAVISPLLVLARAFRPGGTSSGWRLAALIVLAITTVSWILLPKQAGYIAVGAWLALLVNPAIWLRRVAKVFDHQRYKPPRQIDVLLPVWHPTTQLHRHLLLLPMPASDHGI